VGIEPREEGPIFKKTIKKGRELRKTSRYVAGFFWAFSGRSEVNKESKRDPLRYVLH
jgi:hypothetical protein